jgi:hypothetical protein
MGARAITQEFYDLLVQAFRITPGNCSAAAAYAHCDFRTTRRAWELGWPRLPWGKALPIRQVLREEAETARVRMIADEEDTRQKRSVEQAKLTEQSIAGLKAELGLIAAGRVGAVRVLSGWMEIADVLRQLLMAARGQLAESIARGDTIDPDAALELTRKHMLIGQHAARMASELQQMDKLQRGEPTSIMHVDATAQAEMPLEEAVNVIERANELVEMARQEGWLQVERLVSENPRITVDARVLPSGGTSAAMNFEDGERPQDAGGNGASGGVGGAA